MISPFQRNMKVEKNLIITDATLDKEKGFSLMVILV